MLPKWRNFAKSGHTVLYLRRVSVCQVLNIYWRDKEATGALSFSKALPVAGLNLKFYPSLFILTEYFIFIVTHI